MNPHSVLAYLLHPGSNEAQVAADVRKIEEAMRLAPRTAADELPPYRGQPWIIDKQGYRKVDPSLTLVPVSRL
jgi:hypothetical protein